MWIVILVLKTIQGRDKMQGYCKCGAKLDRNGNCPFDEQVNDVEG